MQDESTQAFTVRFRTAIHDRLKAIAQIEHIPMNVIVTSAVEYELERRTDDIRGRLEDTLSKLESFEMNEAAFEEDVVRFAAGEERGDPLQAEHLEPDDPYGIGDLFADPVER